VLLPKCQYIIMNSKAAFKFTCFEFFKVCTGLFETFLSNIMQKFCIFEQELSSDTYGITLIATVADTYLECKIFDLNPLLLCEY
jgi:hypothetical protein